MRKVLGLLLLLISVFTLVACGDKTIDTNITAPTNVEISDEGILTWNAVSGADYYIVYIDQRPVEVRDGTSLNLTEENILVGTRIITVVTVKGDSQSLPSTAVNYTVVALSDPEVIAEGVLALMDPAYTSTSLTRNDFAYDWEFENYQEQLLMANAYAEATSSINMTEANALGFFEELNEMMSAGGGPENLSALMTEMEMFDTYDVNPYAAATIIYHLLLVSLEMQYENEIEYEFGSPEETLAMIEALEDNSIITIQSLEIIIDFLMTFKDSLSSNVIGLFDDAIEGDALTTAEMIIIKNEIVGILQDNLPSVTDFAFLYSTLMYITGAMTGEDVSGYIVHADFMGELTHLEITIMLEFIGSVDAQTVDDIQQMISDISSSMVPDFTGGVDLVLYVLTYIDDFKNDQAALFADFDELMEDEALEELFVLAIDQVIFQIENDPYMSVGAEAIIEMLQAYKAEYDTIKAAMDLFATMGENVIDELISSQAQLLYVFFEMVESGFETPEEGMAAIVEDLLPLFVDYNTAIFGELDQEGILTILEFLRLPVTFALMMSMYDGGMSVGTMGAMEVMEFEIPDFESILPDVAQVIANIITLERAIVNAAVAMNVDAILANDDIASEVKAMLLGIVAIDGALTTANKALITTTIGIIFDDILKDSDMMALHGLGISEIDAMKSAVLTEVNGFIDELQDIADFNFSALTYDDETRIEDMMMIVSSILEGLFDDGGNSPDEYMHLYNDFVSDIYYGEDDIWLQFVPEVSGVYVIFSTFDDDSYDPYISLYDGDMNFIDSDDDGSSYLNFYLMYYLEEGQTYYYLLGSYDNYVYIPIEFRLVESN